MTTKHHPQGRITVRRARLAAAVGIVLGVALPTHAQTRQASAAEANEPPASSAETQPANPPANQGGEQLDTIIVTGSNSAMAWAAAAQAA